jgi:glutamine amidotransferase
VISIVDYGLGNIRAFLNVFQRLGIEARTAQTADELRGAERVILPGVGHFDHAMQRLEASGMRAELDELVLGRKVPVLGVCVGMQMLGLSSDEGELPGLGWIEGRVRGFRSIDAAGELSLPHMGWNDVHPAAANPLFRDLEPEPRFYFLHSFFFEAAHDEDVAAKAAYGTEFTAAVSRGNIHGVQFHPEKSHHFGTNLLKNFAEL